MKITEIFYSIDGECPRQGMPTVFIRRAGCNLHCTYSGENGDCDTPYRDEGVEYSVEEIISKVKRVGGECKNVTFTGGEPLLPHPDRDKLRKALHDAGYFVNIETNGTMSTKHRYPNEIMVVDYKCDCSGMRDKMNAEAFKYLTSKDVIKLVVDDKDFENLQDILSEVLSLVTDGLSADTYIAPLPTIYLSPCFGRVDVVKLVDAVKRISKAQQVFTIGLSLQLHKLIWEPSKRAV